MFCSFEENAVTSIQAVIRGKLTRKKSLTNVSEDEPETMETDADADTDADRLCSGDGDVNVEDEGDEGDGMETTSDNGSYATEEMIQEECDDILGTATTSAAINVTVNSDTMANTPNNAVPAVVYQKKYDSRGMPLLPNNRSISAPSPAGLRYRYHFRYHFRYRYRYRYIIVIVLVI